MFTATLAVLGIFGCIAAKDIQRGVTIEAHHTSSGCSSSENKSIIGWITKRVIKKGELLDRPAIAPPNLLIDKSSTRAIYKDADLLVSINVIALGDGSLGDTVLVRTPNRRRIKTVVTDTNTVLIIR